MMTSSLQVLSILPWLIVLLAQWVGVLAMRGERTAAWWLMFSGMLGISLGMIGMIAGMFLTFANLGTPGVSDPSSLSRQIAMTLISSVITGGGTLAWAAGFAMHGLKRRAALAREQQLEAMTAAMAEELRVLRERVG